MSTSVLYDQQGPRGKRRTIFGSVIAAAALLALLAFVVLELVENEQFTAEKWGPLLNPNHEQFDLVWTRLAEGAVNTLYAAAWAILFSLVLGTLIAVTRVTAARWWRWGVVGVVEFLRGVPVVITIFFVWRAFPEFGIHLPTMWYLVIGLTLYNSVIIAEIVRAGINSVPTGQREAGESLGLRRGQVLTQILLPQGFRVMLPALISQLVVVLKDTSLGYIITYEESVLTAEVIVENLNNPLQTFFIVAVAFILVNYSLSRLAMYLERRLSRGRKAAPEAEEAAAAEAETTGA